MSTFGLVVLCVVAVLVALFVGGYVVNLRRYAARRNERGLHIAHADQALEAARAEDRGWDRQVLERIAADAVEQQRPGWPYESLQLVLVEDRPGIEEDRAHLVAEGAGGDELRIVLTRRGGEWAPDWSAPGNA